MATMVAQDNATLARRIYELFSNDKFDDVLALARDDVEVVFVPAGQTFRGHEGFTQFMQSFKSAFPDIKLTVTNQIATDEYVVTEFIAAGTHTGPLLTPAGAIPPTGKRAEWPVCEVWQMRDGKLASIHNYQDLATMLRQLGLIP
jgi:steroid delta-isomerase-like uncharacterized protein